MQAYYYSGFIPCDLNANSAVSLNPPQLERLLRRIKYDLSENRYYTFAAEAVSLWEYPYKLPKVSEYQSIAADYVARIKCRPGQCHIAVIKSDPLS